MVLRNALVLALVCLRAAWAEPSVPIATNPVYTTETLPTVSQTISTYTSYVTSSAVYQDLSTYTTTVSGSETVLTATQEKTTFTTVTNIGVSTVYVTQQTVVVSKIGDSTVFSGDPTTATSSPSASTVSTPTTATAVVTTSSSVPGTTHHQDPSSGSSSTSGSPSHTNVASTSLPKASTPANTNSTGFGQTISPPSRGLSAGDKAGVGIGTALGVIALFCIVFYLGQIRARRKAATNGKGDFYDPEDDFLSQSHDTTPIAPAAAAIRHTPQRNMSNARRYSARQPSWQPSVRQPSTRRHSVQRHSTQRPEQLTRPGYEMPNPRLSNGIELSGAQIYEKGDDGHPVYVGVPAHMAGVKRDGSTRSGTTIEKPFDGMTSEKNQRMSVETTSRSAKRSTYDSIYPEDNEEEKMNYF